MPSTCMVSFLSIFMYTIFPTLVFLAFLCIRSFLRLRFRREEFYQGTSFGRMHTTLFGMHSLIVFSNVSVQAYIIYMIKIETSIPINITKYWSIIIPVSLIVFHICLWYVEVFWSLNNKDAVTVQWSLSATGGNTSVVQMYWGKLQTAWSKHVAVRSVIQVGSLIWHVK